jgi:hypothetical protein
MKTTIRERLIAELEARGEREVRRTKKYIVYSMSPAPGLFFYIGKSGAFRQGPTIKRSLPVDHKFIRSLIGHAIERKVS